MRWLTKIRKQYDEVADVIVAQIESLRDAFKNNKAMQAAVKGVPKRQMLSRGTRIIVRELIGGFLRDKGLRPSRNDAIDLSHAVVAVSHCDYVLLDSKWAAMVNELRSRMNRAGVLFPLAQVFSKRANGIETFLRELEGKLEPDR